MEPDGRACDSAVAFSTLYPPDAEGDKQRRLRRSLRPATARFQRLNSAVDDVTDAAKNEIRYYDVDSSVDVLIQSLGGAGRPYSGRASKFLC